MKYSTPAVRDWCQTNWPSGGGGDHGRFSSVPSFSTGGGPCPLGQPVCAVPSEFQNQNWWFTRLQCANGVGKFTELSIGPLLGSEGTCQISVRAAFCLGVP